MVGIISIIILGTLVGIILYGKYQKSKIDIEYFSNKTKQITKNINDEILGKIESSYYDSMSKIISNEINEVYRKEKGRKVDNFEKRFKMIDDIYCELKQNIRLIEEYEEFVDKFPYRKRKYRMSFNNSVNIVNLLEEKYGDYVDKYITNFNSDFETIKGNDIQKLNKLVNESNEYYISYDIYQLKRIFNEIRKIDCDLYLKIDEPIRLRDKFIKSEDNIDQLENELVNVKGSLYHKVFDIIKNNKVSKSDIDEWNRIKRNINNFKKSKLLKSDIIDLNNKLNSIINDITELNDIIRKDKVNVKIDN